MSIAALLNHYPRVAQGTYPVFIASYCVAGLVTIIFSIGTPLSTIYFTDVRGKYPPDCKNSLSYVS